MFEIVFFLHILQMYILLNNKLYNKKEHIQYNIQSVSIKYANKRRWP